MEARQIFLTEVQYSNLLTFLSRASLSGTEAEEFVRLQQSIRNAQKVRLEVTPPPQYETIPPIEHTEAPVEE